VAQFRSGQTDDAITTLKAALPQHALAALAAPRQVDQIRLSRLLGETCLALAYQKLGDREAVGQHIKTVREVLQQLEKPSTKPSDGLMPWSIPLARAITKRELLKLSDLPEQK
jgi:hypothetical protein